MRTIKMLTAALALSALVPSALQAQATVTVDPNIEYQTLTGIGGSDNENDSLADAQRAVNELGASTFRIFYDFDLYEFEKNNDNADPNSFNWSAYNMSAIRPAISYVRHLKSAGLKHFFYSVLAVPQWMKVRVPTPQSGVASWCSGQCGGYFDTTKYEEYAECLTAWVKVLKDSVVELDAVCIQNEPAFEEPYGSCVFTPQQMRDAAKATARRFRQLGINTRIVVGEDVIGGQNAKAFIGLAAVDTSLRPSLVAGAVHNYAGDGITASSPAAVAWRSVYTTTSRFGLEHWMTETSGFANDWQGSMSAASVMYGAFKYGKLNLWAWLDYPRPTEPGLFAITKNYSKYIRPGAIQVESATSDTNVMPLSFRDKATNTLVVVLINRTGTPRTVNLSGTGMPAQVRLYRSTATDRFVDAGMVQSNSISIAATSVNTLVGTNYNPPVAVAQPAVLHNEARPSPSSTLAALYRLDGKRVTGGLSAKVPTSAALGVIIVADEARASGAVRHAIVGR